jgi:thioredoxin reductase
MDERYDVVVIGGGAAGLSGALTPSRGPAQGLKAGAMINADLIEEDTARAVAGKRSVAA